MSDRRKADSMEDMLTAWNSTNHNLLYNGVYVMELLVVEGGSMLLLFLKNGKRITTNYQEIEIEIL